MVRFYQFNIDDTVRMRLGDGHTLWDDSHEIHSSKVRAGALKNKYYAHTKAGKCDVASDDIAPSFVVTVSIQIASIFAMIYHSV